MKDADQLKYYQSFIKLQKSEKKCKYIAKPNGYTDTMKNAKFLSFLLCLLLLPISFPGCGLSTAPYGPEGMQDLFHDYTVPPEEDFMLHYDVVVVGAGLAGISAAITAAESGQSVALIEKMPTIGGNSIYSTGTFNAVDPVRQQEQGVEDSLELFIKQTYEGGGSIGNLDLISLLCENAGSARSWLQAHGVTWSDRGVYLPSGGAWPRSLDIAQGANRGLILPLAQSVVNAGGDIIRDYRVVALIQEGDRVVGVRAVHTLTGEEHAFFAQKGVILATGGYGSNLDMIHEYNADIPEQVDPETTPAATGDGILLALRVGADLVDMEYVQMVPGAVKDCVYFTSEIGSAIYVNQDGKRFASEQLPNSELCREILSQKDSIAYVIFDSNTIGPDFVDNAGRSVAEFQALSKEGLCGYGETIEELAQNIGLDPQTLQDTVDSFNRIVDGLAADPFGRELFYKKIDDGPYYASIRTAKIHYTMGGLRINTRAQVLSTEGTPIEGLYACGEVTGGIHGTNHVSGNALSDCVVFGRIAAQSACD